MFNSTLKGARMYYVITQTIADNPVRTMPWMSFMDRMLPAGTPMVCTPSELATTGTFRCLPTKDRALANVSLDDAAAVAEILHEHGWYVHPNDLRPL